MLIRGLKRLFLRFSAVPSVNARIHAVTFRGIPFRLHAVLIALVKPRDPFDVGDGLTGPAVSRAVDSFENAG